MIKDKNFLFFSEIFIRYLLVALSFLLIPIFYTLFLPLTIFILYLILKIFYSVSLTGNLLIFNNVSVEVVPACIAGSAYLLLLILNLFTREIKIEKRILMFLFSVLALFILNVIRLLILIPLYVSRSSFFDFSHKFFWYFLSIVFVFLIWFLTIKLFKVKKIPVYSDIICIINSLRNKKK